MDLREVRETILDRSQMQYADVQTEMLNYLISEVYEAGVSDALSDELHEGRITHEEIAEMGEMFLEDIFGLEFNEIDDEEVPD